MLYQVLLKRLQKNIDAKLREEQARFRHGRSCNWQIFTLRDIIEQSLEYRKPLIINYVDFIKAFDSIYRSTLWKIRKIYGIPQKYIIIFQELYTISWYCVKTGSGTTNYFKFETGVQQGDIPSPFFFLIVMDYIMEKAMSPSHFRIIWQETKLTDLDFADDLALLTNECE